MQHGNNNVNNKQTKITVTAKDKENLNVEQIKEEAAIQNPERIDFKTFHGSKGLEYDVVFIVNVNKGIVPHKRAKDDASLEEERRVFYVAMTRAKKYLFILSPKNLRGRQASPSPFIREIM
ncbi:MAG: 3'-5' exonuclease [Eubacteriales bacterium]|nr:3'-5' exonuclease [Eubacteriales bacterium]